MPLKAKKTIVVGTAAISANCDHVPGRGVATLQVEQCSGDQG